MIWICESNGPLRGEGCVKVTNKRTGLTGYIDVRYFPCVEFVGPVYVADDEADPSDPDSILDRRPKVRCVDA